MIFFLCNWWWIHICFFANLFHYLCCLSIMVIFCYLPHFLSSSYLVFCWSQLPSCGWPGTYCVYFPLSLGTDYNTVNLCKTRPKENPFLSLVNQDFIRAACNFYSMKPACIVSIWNEKGILGCHKCDCAWNINMT